MVLEHIQTRDDLIGDVQLPQHPPEPAKLRRIMTHVLDSNRLDKDI